ncbi:DUF4199 domain-containing protein [Dokdonia sp. Hel_I_53]|uniref:DUF4199 domain-containing protein n=1 Tax=Dokdonia sp. Hel_I_53 TaxID=1566287 RepID=UPI00119A0A86|nr:DUF4199 domain-containing protein [Dokdonia sp. Hel_I_53]TVZ52493.1 uncharacterized protein DUF4199 [Dokdonia sp. Hel_I_53]
MGLAVKKFGMIAFLSGFIGFGAALFLGKSLDYSTQELIGYAVIGMVVALVYFGIAYRRDTVNAGQITFSQALQTGIVIAICGALGIALIDVIFTQFIHPDFFRDYNAYQLQLAEESGIPSKIEQAQNASKSYQNISPLKISLMAGAMMFFMTFTLGSLCAVLSGVILKRTI